MSYILVVDDDEAIRDMLQLLLTRKGHSVEVAANGGEGERLIGQSVPDLVITDMMMPEEDGMELLMHLRAHAPNIPIIAISGGGRGFSYDPLPTAEKLGAHRTFAKPLDPKELLSAVQELLEA